MRLLKPIRVQANKKALRGFKAIAKQFYPREAWGALFGHDRETSEGRVVEVREIWVPDDLKKYTTDKAVYWNDDWWVDLEETAQESGLEVVGDIHSHPGYWRDLAPSDYDWSQRRWDALCGIVGVWEFGSTLRSRVKFWGPMAPVVG